jgi:hypothetical protein
MQKQSALPGGSTELDQWNNTPELQKALQINFVLKGHLKNAQIAYLRIAVLLSEFRDEKLYALMDHSNLADYALKHLGLHDASLKRYLRVHDWVKVHHPEWLEQKPKGFIPDLSDINDLIWLEEELGRKAIDPDRRKALTELRDKALSGQLTEDEMRAFRKGSHKSTDGLRTFLAALRALVRRAGKLVGMPQAAMEHLDAAVGILEDLVQHG